MAGRYLNDDNEPQNSIFRTNKYARAYRIYMLAVIATVGYSWIYLQAFHVILKNTAEGVSIEAILIYLVTSVSWLVYGILKRDKVIIVGSTISIIGNIFLLSAVTAVNNK